MSPRGTVQAPEGGASTLHGPSRRSAWSTVWSWAFVLVPTVALGELGAHAWIVRRAPSSDEWQAARRFIARERRAGDLVASAPVWSDPLARQHFAGLVSLRDAARPDATRYRRALVATLRGGRHPDFAGWPEERVASFGRLAV